MRIHPTAIIEDGAQIGEDVEVGPYALIGPEVTLGNQCRVLSHAVITGRTFLGDRNVVGHGAVIGAPPQDFAYNEAMASSVRIGNGNTFREHVTIHCGTGQGGETVVGDDNFVMAGVHFAHNCVVGSRTVIANNCLLAGYVQIGDGAVLGGGTVFHQHLRVGRLAMVRGGTRFGKDIAPFTVADRDNLLAGLNVIGLRRAGLSSEVRMELKRVFKRLFRSGLNVSQALEALSGEEWGPEAREMIEFVRSSRRGVSIARGRSSAPEDGD